MIDRQTAETAMNYWRAAKRTELSPAARLEQMLIAFQLVMTEVITDNDTVQRFWESTGLLPLMLAAADDEPIDEGGTVRKDSMAEYQALHLSFRKWINTPVTANMPTGAFEEDGITPIMAPVTLTKTPAQLIMQPPVTLPRVKTQGLLVA